MKTNEFFDFYKDKTKDKTTVNKIGRFLAKLEVKPIKMSNNAGYKYVRSSKELLETFQKLNFMDDIVDHISNNDRDAPESERENIYKIKYEEAMKRIQELERVLSKQNPHAWQEKQLKKQTKTEYKQTPGSLSHEAPRLCHGDAQTAEIVTQEEEEPINDLDVIVDIMLN